MVVLQSTVAHCSTIIDAHTNQTLFHPYMMMYMYIYMYKIFVFLTFNQEVVPMYMYVLQQKCNGANCTVSGL